MKKKIIVITVGNENAGSTKYRIKQYEPFLNEQHFHLQLISQHQLKKSSLSFLSYADLIINQKCLLGCSLSRNIFKVNCPIIFDFDDSIYTRPGRPYSLLTQWRVNRRLELWLKHAHRVTTANRYLEKYALSCRKQVDVIPMTLNLEQWHPISRTHPGIRMGWVGAPCNLHHLEKLQDILSYILHRYPHVSLAVYSGKKPKLRCPFEYTSYAPEKEIAFVQSLDIGLLPLSDEEFSRGKSPIKALQYQACGSAVVGNAFGATREILSEDNSLIVRSHEEWKIALERIINDKKLRLNLAEKGRQKVCANHSIEQGIKQWRELLSKII